MKTVRFIQWFIYDAIANLLYFSVILCHSFFYSLKLAASKYLSSILGFFIIIFKI